MTPLRRLATAVSPGRLLIAAGAAATADLSALALTATATWLLVRAAQLPPIAALALAVVGVRGFALCRGGLRYLERLAGHDAALGALATLRTRVFAAVERRGGPGGRDGDTVARLVGDVDAVTDLVVRCLLPAVSAAVVALGAIGLTTVVLPVTGAVLAAGLVPAGVVVPAIVHRSARRVGGRAVRARAELVERADDLVEGAAELAAYGALDAAGAAFDAAGERLAALRTGAVARQERAAAVVLALQGLTTVGVVVVVVALAHDRLDPTWIAVLALVALAAFDALVPLVGAAVRLVEVGAAAGRLAAELDAPPVGSGPRTHAALPPGPVPVRLRGAVVRHDGNRAPALDGVDLAVGPGRRVGVVGASGSGKSTLLAALMRSVPLDAGSLTLGGVDATSLSGEVVRGRITGLTQDAHVFHATLRANLLLARPEAGDADLDRVLRRARLTAAVAGMPAGLDTVLGDDGAGLSGGERRRLLLARALLADPDLLVLDEPLEGLDDPTARDLLRDLLAATRDRSLLLVTHCLPGLEELDEIVVLDAGRVVQRGGHQALAGVPGPYRRLREAHSASGGPTTSRGRTECSL